MIRFVKLAVLGLGLVGLTACFGDGVYVVGTGTNEVAPGLYSAPGGLDCAWARFLGGVSDGEVVGGNYEINRMFAEIDAADTFFGSEACGIWDTPQPGPYTVYPNAIVESDQDHRVGIDMTAGTWASSGSGECSWVRLRDWKWSLDDSSFIDAGTVTGPTTVVVAATDVGFESFGCGGWYRTGDVPN